MKPVKFICFFIIYCLLTIFVGEMHFERSAYAIAPFVMFELDNKDGYYSTEYILNTLRAEAKRANVNFVTGTNIGNAEIRYYTVYADDDMKAEFIKNGMVEGKNPTFMRIPTIISFEPLENLDFSGVALIISPVSGNLYDALAFEKAVLKVFHGRHWDNGNLEIFKPHRVLLFKAFLYMCAVSALLSLYGVLAVRKEVLVRLTLGMDLNAFVLKNIAFDAALYAGIFFYVRYMLSFSGITLVGLYTAEQLAALAVVIILNACSYLSLYFIGIKRAFSKVQIGMAALIPGYLLKATVCLLTFCLSALALHRSARFLNLQSEEEYFKSYGAFSHVNIYVRPEKMENVNQILKGMPATWDKFYKHFYVPFDAQVLYTADYTRNIMFANINAKPLLSERIQGFEGFTSEADFIFVAQKELSDDAISFLRYLAETQFAANDTFSADVFYYKQRLRLPSFGGAPDMWYYAAVNPTLIYVNYPPDENESTPTDITPNYMGGHQYFAYKVDNELFNEYNKENRLYRNYNIDFQNVYGKYAGELSKTRGETVYAHLNACLLFIINAVLGAFTVKIRYKALAVQIAVMRTLGYSLPQRHKSVFAVSGLIFLLVFPVYYYISIIYIKLPFDRTLILFGFFLLLETIFLTYYLLRYERINIIRTLKGGIL